MAVVADVHEMTRLRDRPRCRARCRRGRRARRCICPVVAFSFQIPGSRVRIHRAVGMIDQPAAARVVAQGAAGGQVDDQLLLVHRSRPIRRCRRTGEPMEPRPEEAALGRPDAAVRRERHAAQHAAWRQVSRRRVQILREGAGQRRRREGMAGARSGHRGEPRRPAGDDRDRHAKPDRHFFLRSIFTHVSHSRPTDQPMALQSFAFRLADSVRKRLSQRFGRTSIPHDRCHALPELITSGDSEATALTSAT